MEKRKRIEQDRYERMALAGARQRTCSPSDGFSHSAEVALGAASVAAPLRRPYLQYERAIRAVTPEGAVVLDLGAGTGTHSFISTGSASVIVATDIALSPLRIARERGPVDAIAAVVADSENLPIRDGSVDVVTSAGILYCHDLPALAAEVMRVLVPGGHWVLVDSFDHNPMYRLNRFIGRLRGTRTQLAVTNIPNMKTLAYLRARFSKVEASYHGIFAFAAPLLTRLFGTKSAAKLVDAADSALPMLSRYAFKIVVTLQRY
jgi:ubiquinone/menaquinone biosynthesis C-methylase UbiE